MNLSITAIFYGLVGASVSVALFLNDATCPRHERWFRVLTGFLFWPIFLPLLLKPATLATPHECPADKLAAPADEMAVRIGQAENELNLALRSLAADTNSSAVPGPDRLGEMHAAWHRQAERIRELDRLLAQPAFVDSAVVGFDSSAPELVAHSEQTRQQNLARLREIRQQMHQRLLETLAGVRELVTRIHLAKYTGTPAPSELATQITSVMAGSAERT